MTSRQVLLLVLLVVGLLLLPCMAAALLGLGWFLLRPYPCLAISSISGICSSYCPR